jgi:hypothetical protein
MAPRCLVRRRPPHHFRGLLRLYSRYGPPNRSVAQGDLCHEASARTLLNRTARQLPDLSTIIWVEPSSTGDSRRQGALPLSDPSRSNRLLPLRVRPVGIAVYCKRATHSPTLTRRRMLPRIPIKYVIPQSMRLSINSSSQASAHRGRIVFCAGVLGGQH